MSLRVKDGNWQYRFQVNGNRVERGTGLAATEENRAAAEAIEKGAYEAARGGAAESRTPKAGGPQLFEAAAARFLEWAENVEYRGKPGTWRRIKTSFASLKEYFRGREIQDITLGDLEGFKLWRAQCGRVRTAGCEDIQLGIRDVTIRHDLDNLSLFFSYAVRLGHLGENILRLKPKEGGIKRPSDEAAVRMHVLDTDEELKYFAAAAKASPDLWDLARLILLQGCRPDELYTLRKDCVHLEPTPKFPHGVIRIQKGKTRAARRTLALTKDSAQILKRRLKLGWANFDGEDRPGMANRKRDRDRRERFLEKFGASSPWVFPSPWTGGHLTKLNGAHDRALERSDTSFCLYDLRHTFATRMVESGCDLPTLAAILGHSSLRMVMKYVHPTEAHQAQAMAAYQAQEKKRLRAIVPIEQGRTRQGSSARRVS